MLKPFHYHSKLCSNLLLNTRGGSLTPRAYENQERGVGGHRELMRGGQQWGEGDQLGGEVRGNSGGQQLKGLKSLRIPLHTISISLQNILN